MALDLNEAAKRAFIAYRQLDAIVKEPVGVDSATSYAESYNRILETLNQCFAIDKSFSDAVSHLKPLEKAHGAVILSYQLDAYGAILLATAHDFIEMYLSPEEKKKAFGFNT
jgi:hypothetical protein